MIYRRHSFGVITNFEPADQSSAIRRVGGKQEVLGRRFHWFRCNAGKRLVRWRLACSWLQYCCPAEVLEFSFERFKVVIDIFSRFLGEVYHNVTRCLSLIIIEKSFG